MSSGMVENDPESRVQSANDITPSLSTSILAVSLNIQLVF